MRNVMIAGIAEPVHGRISGMTPMALHERLALDALADAGLELRDVDAILTLAPLPNISASPRRSRSLSKAEAPRRQSWWIWHAT
jgi:hypothetical protein